MTYDVVWKFLLETKPKRSITNDLRKTNDVQYKANNSYLVDITLV